MSRAFDVLKRYGVLLIRFLTVLVGIGRLDVHLVGLEV